MTVSVEHGNEGDDDEKQVESRNEEDSARLEMSVEICVRDKSSELFDLLTLRELGASGGLHSDENKRAAEEYLLGGGMTDELESEEVDREVAEVVDVMVVGVTVLVASELV